ncbi:NrsF family protein [Novosphingobium rosa]|uniref:NrsF family protein n=1 Tax=Novosphingobium rosa TaxID=76978 RepID=UPI000830A2F2|nr:NrsF family protein [Novosphingobium rosa]
MVDSGAGSATNHDLIDQLSASLTPVRRPRPAAMRALGWAALALPCGFAMTRLIPHYQPDWHAPMMMWSMMEIPLALCIGAGALVLAFQASIAGQGLRGRGVLAALVLAWLTISIANVVVSPPHPIRPGAGMYCFTFMMLGSAPIMPMVIWALRRTRALRPGRVLALAGTGIAFLVAGLLGFCHPGSLHPIDFVMHLAAGLTIVGLTTLLGRRLIVI